MTQDGWQQAPSQPASPPSYSSAPPGPTSAPTNGKAIAALVLGILGCCVLPILFSIPAIILGFMARKEVQRSNGAQAGDGMALAGIILGAVGILAGIVIGVLFAVGLAAVPSECIEDAESAACEQALECMENPNAPGCDQSTATQPANLPELVEMQRHAGTSWSQMAPRQVANG